MKGLFTKILAVGIIASGALVANGQENVTENNETKLGTPVPVAQGELEGLTKEFLTKKHGKLAVEEWYDYLNAVSQNGEGFTYFINSSIMPDSNAVQIFRDDNDNPETGHVSTFAVGQVFDPKSELYDVVQDQYRLSRFNAYTVDSMAFFYKYNNPNPGVTDTVVIDVYNNNDVVGLTYTNNNTGQQWRSASMRYNKNVNGGYSPTNQIKIPISQSTPNFFDASLQSFFQANISFATGLSETSRNGLTSFTVSFVPGMAYNFGDTISNDSAYQGSATKLSSFQPLIIRQGTVQNPAFLADTSMSHGVFVWDFVRYTTRSTEYFYPGNLVTTPARQHVYGLVKLASPNVSVEDLTRNGYGLGNAYPNPASANATVNIPFTLGNAETVTVEMFDLVGKKVAEASDVFAAGENTISLSTNNLNSGIYMYTIHAGEFVATKKFTVK